MQFAASSGVPYSRDFVIPRQYESSIWVETEPRNEESSLAVADRINNFTVITSALDEAQVMAEAKRCFSCGKCFGCDACFSYCQEGAIKIAPADAGQKYEFNLSLCTGCKKCSEECPCGYIDMV